VDGVCRRGEPRDDPRGEALGVPTRDCSVEVDARGVPTRDARAEFTGTGVEFGKEGIFASENASSAWPGLPSVRPCADSGIKALSLARKETMIP